MKKFIAPLALLSLVAVGAVPVIETEEASVEGVIVANFGRDGASCGFSSGGFSGIGQSTYVFNPRRGSNVQCHGFIDQEPPSQPYREMDDCPLGPCILVINPGGTFNLILHF